MSKSKRTYQPHEREQRLTEVYSLRQQGLTLKEIGDRYGVSRERIRQMVAVVDRRVKRQKMTAEPIER